MAWFVLGPTGLPGRKDAATGHVANLWPKETGNRDPRNGVGRRVRKYLPALAIPLLPKEITTNSSIWKIHVTGEDKSTKVICITGCSLWAEMAAKIVGQALSNLSWVLKVEVQRDEEEPMFSHRKHV